MTKNSRQTGKLICKRVFDAVVASFLFLITLPLQIILVIVVAITLGRPVFFCQKRPGKDGAVFTLIKLRTMKEVDHKRGLVTDAQRLTRLGRILRASSLDELPTLINVVAGSMSMVGPRPFLVEYLELYTPHQARRHEVRPGVTGLAQVNGRNELTWEEKFDFDVRYVDTHTFWGDIRILLATVVTVLKRSGTSHSGHSTMPRFTGIASSQEERS